MAELTGFKKFADYLRDEAAKVRAAGDPSVAVGYTAGYALYVHENMEIWPPGMRLKGLPRGSGYRRDPKTGALVVYVPKNTSGTVGFKNRGYYWDPLGKAQPKFLEDPFRRLQTEFQRIIMEALKAGKTLAQGLVLAGLRLQRESQKLVPVNYGNLKASAFTRLEQANGETQDVGGGI